MKSRTDDKQTFEYTAFVTGDCDIAVFGLSARDRLKKQLQRLRIAAVGDLADADIVLSDECVYGASVLQALLDAEPGMLLIDNQGFIAGARCHTERNAAKNAALAALFDEPTRPDGRLAKTGAELAGRYDEVLRKRTDPTVLRIHSKAEIEKALFAASYKGVTDFVTKHVWPAPALIVTRWCAANRITPNQVTLLSAVFAVLAFWLFWYGNFILGMIFAWMMTFLDTVDGKLARVTLTSSSFGNIFDHGIDLVHPPFWWWAWAVGCAAYGTPLQDGGLTVGVILGGYVLQRIAEGIFIFFFGMHMHVWRRFDSFFRQITARRNPNLVILTLFLFIDAPREGLIVVALWTLVSLLVHLAQIVQAAFAVRHGPLSSWLSED